jgi:nucleoside-diphosphate-sugar epimerase
MRILLTGSSGWLGRHIADLLVVAGVEFVGLDVAPGRHTSVTGSVADAALVEELASSGITGIIHTAALHKPQLERRCAREFVTVNVSGTLNLLEAAVRAGVSSFVMTSTTSVMVTQKIHEGGLTAAVFLDEASGPLEPRNIYGVTKLCAEGLCRSVHLQHRLPVIVLRTSRFFPEEDDSDATIAGANLKANEFLYRRLSVADAARAHLLAVRRAPELGFGTFVLSAPTPFGQGDARELVENAEVLVSRHFPRAPAIYRELGWELPRSIGRVYDSIRSREILGFSYEDDFGALLDELAAGGKSILGHDPSYRSPLDGVGPLRAAPAGQGLHHQSAGRSR